MSKSTIDSYIRSYSVPVVDPTHAHTSNRQTHRVSYDGSVASPKVRVTSGIANEVLLDSAIREARSLIQDNVIDTALHNAKYRLSLCPNTLEHISELINDVIYYYNNELLNPKMPVSILTTLDFLNDFWTAFGDLSKGEFFRKLCENETQFLEEQGFLGLSKEKKATVLEEITKNHLFKLSPITTDFLQVKKYLQETVNPNISHTKTIADKISFSIKKGYWEDHYHYCCKIYTGTTPGVYSLVHKLLYDVIKNTPLNNIDISIPITCLFATICLESQTDLMPAAFLNHYVTPHGISIHEEFFGKYGIKLLDYETVTKSAVSYAISMNIDSTISPTLKNALFSNEGELKHSLAQYTNLKEILGDTALSKLKPLLMHAILHPPHVVEVVRISIIMKMVSGLRHAAVGGTSDILLSALGLERNPELDFCTIFESASKQPNPQLIQDIAVQMLQTLSTEPNKSRLDDIKKILLMNPELSEYIAGRYDDFKDFWKLIKLEAKVTALTKALVLDGLLNMNKIDSNNTPPSSTISDLTTSSSEYSSPSSNTTECFSMSSPSVPNQDILPISCSDNHCRDLNGFSTESAIEVSKVPSQFISSSSLSIPIGLVQASGLDADTLG